jgi:hypothetical protein
MSSRQTLQQAIDSYVQQLSPAHRSENGTISEAEACLETLAQYLIHYSDLFHERDMAIESDFAEWEEALDQHMMELLDGDVEVSGDLGSLPLDALDSEHIRDFLGWFLLRETSDAELIQAYANVLLKWIDFIHARGWWKDGDYLGFTETLAEVTPTAVRAARLSRVLFHFVRSGGGVPPRLRGKQFSCFVEGHGRVVRLEDNAMRLNFDNQDQQIGPVVLPHPIFELVEQGDVFDVELGLRGDVWVMVDIGPVYPACVYVEVEEYQGLEKLS